ncbi:hypothetical protein D9M71_777160 [compost metagenome]
MERHGLAPVFVQGLGVVVRQLGEQHREQVLGQAAAQGRRQPFDHGTLVQTANIIEGFAHCRDARVVGRHLDVEHQRLLERPVEQFEQLALQCIAFNTQDQVAAILVDTDQAAL